MLIDTTPQLDSGLDPARVRASYYQFKANGPFYRLRSFNFAPDADADQTKFNTHQFDGTNRPDASVMVGIDNLWSGSFAPYYIELPVIHRNLYGAPVSSDLINASYAVDAAGSRRREVFYLAASGGNRRHLWRAQFGDILYGRWKLRSYSGDVTRNGDGGAFSGNVTAHANDILSFGNTIPGLVAANAKFQIVATAVTGNLVVGYKLAGSSTVRSVTHIPGETTIETKAKYEAFGDGVTVNVVGTIAAAVSGTGFAVTGAGDSTYNGAYNPTGANSSNGKPVYSNGTRSLWNQASVPGTKWFFGTTVDSGNGAYYILSSASTPPLGTYTVDSGTSPAPTVGAGSATPAGGTQTIEFAAPANTNITLSKTSGVAGYVVSQLVTGTDGTGPLYIGGTAGNPAPVESDNVLIYMADSWAALNAIDMDNEDAPEIRTGILGHTWSSGDNANAVWTEDRKQAPSNWVSTPEDIAFGITAWKGPATEALRILQEGCTVGKQFYRIAYKCGSWQWWQDGIYSRNEAQGKGADNELPTRTTPFMLMHDAVSSYRVTIIGPATEYFTGL